MAAGVAHRLEAREGAKELEEPQVLNVVIIIVML